VLKAGGDTNSLSGSTQGNGETVGRYHRAAARGGEGQTYAESETEEGVVGLERQRGRSHKKKAGMTEEVFRPDCLERRTKGARLLQKGRIEKSSRKSFKTISGKETSPS